jgi:hypothetical protein
MVVDLVCWDMHTIRADLLDIIHVTATLFVGFDCTIRANAAALFVRCFSLAGCVCRVFDSHDLRSYSWHHLCLRHLRTSPADSLGYWHIRPWCSGLCCF